MSEPWSRPGREDECAVSATSARPVWIPASRTPGTGNTDKAKYEKGKSGEGEGKGEKVKGWEGR